MTIINVTDFIISRVPKLKEYKTKFIVSFSNNYSLNYLNNLDLVEDGLFLIQFSVENIEEIEDYKKVCQNLKYPNTTRVMSEAMYIGNIRDKSSFIHDYLQKLVGTSQGLNYEIVDYEDIGIKL